MSAAPLPRRRDAAVDRRLLATQLGPAIAAPLPRSQQLVLGWLMVCQPAEQSQAEIREAMDLSMGAVSNALRALAEYSLVERVEPRGDRTARYVLPPGAWARAVDHGLALMEQNLALLQEAHADLQRTGDARATRNVGEFVAYHRRLADVMREVAASLGS